MGVLTPDDLQHQWATEQIPAEHAIGQLVQHMARLQRSVDTQRLAIVQLQAALASQPAAPPAPRRAAVKSKATR